MLTTVEGIYHDGKIELSETPINIREGTHVIVTFLTSIHVDLRSRGINKTQAAELRARLSTFAEDWENPEMSIYDNYDEAKTNIPLM